MADMTELLKAARSYIGDHVRLYIETDGADEARIRDNSAIGGDPKTTHLVLRTVGRKSGKERMAPLICKERNGEYVIIASKMGNDAHPYWFANMQAVDEVAIQFGRKRYRCTWRVADGEEREQLWEVMAAYYPQFDQYQTSTSRAIPVVVLTPVGDYAETFTWYPGAGIDGGSDLA